MRADEDPDAHAPPYPEVPRGVQDGVRPVVEAKDGRNISALEEGADPPDKQLDLRDEEPRRKDIIVLKEVARQGRAGRWRAGERLGAPLGLVASVVVVGVREKRVGKSVDVEVGQGEKRAPGGRARLELPVGYRVVAVASDAWVLLAPGGARLACYRNELDPGLVRHDAQEHITSRGKA